MQNSRRRHLNFDCLRHTLYRYILSITHINVKSNLISMLAFACFLYPAKLQIKCLQSLNINASRMYKLQKLSLHLMIFFFWP